MPTIGPAFEPLPDDPGERAEVEQLRDELQDQLDRGATHAFSPSFGLAALLGLLALIPIGARAEGRAVSGEARLQRAGPGRSARSSPRWPGRRLPGRRRLLLRAGEDPGPLQARPWRNPGRPAADRRAVLALGPRRRRLQARGEPRDPGPGAGDAGGARTLHQALRDRRREARRGDPRRPGARRRRRRRSRRPAARCSPARCATRSKSIPLDQAIELINDAESLLDRAQSFLGPAQGLLEQFLP